ncbi:MAG: pyridoxal-phosphate dependent enzyme [Bacteroidetes bacterium]|nr:MAG: pyridoxal-phosphate dependent enzyme [Bacteroidota bacterium]
MSTSFPPAPSLHEIKEAHHRILPFIHRTPVLTCQGINRLVKAELWFKCENLQKVGAFKARGATNAVRSLDSGQLRKGVATHSSGNHAQALSWTARLAGTTAHIVMPTNSNRVKVDAVKEYGGLITFCEPTLESRETTLNTVLQETGAVEIHPYNNLKIIAGQATSTVELLQEKKDLEIVMAPVGGGGLLSGTALACHYLSPGTRVIAAEPTGADDAYRSFTQRTLIPSVDPDTIADGLRTSLGSLTFPIILALVTQILTVQEESIVLAMRLLWERMKVIVEPSAAVPLAALLEGHAGLRGKRIGIILSGGNADLDHLPWNL